MKDLKTYATKRFKGLTDNLISYQQVEDPEVLHLIRLESKKIKSILNLLQYGIKSFKGHKHYIPFRTIFRRAGEIRQPEVIYKLLLQYQLEGITDSQIPKTDQVERLTLIFRDDVPKFKSLVSTQRKRLKKYNEVLSKKKARKYITKRRLELKALLFPDFQSASLHKTRKIIKEVIFLKWIDKKSITFYKKIEKIIGLWHDKQVVLGMLNNDKYKNQVSILIASCQEDLTILARTIHSFYGKAKGKE